jgi:hypothetical protein
MHRFIDREKCFDESFQNKLYWLFLKSATADTKELLQEKKKVLKSISELYSCYYVSIIDDFKKVLTCIEALTVNELEKNYREKFLRMYQSFDSIKTKCDCLLKDSGGEVLSGKLDENVQSHYFLFHKQILFKPQYQFRVKNFNNFIKQYREKGVSDKLLDELKESLKELDFLVNVGIENFSKFKKTKSVSEAHLSFGYRWKTPYAYIDYFGVKSLKLDNKKHLG